MSSIIKVIYINFVSYRIGLSKSMFFYVPFNGAAEKMSAFVVRPPIEVHKVKNTIFTRKRI